MGTQISLTILHGGASVGDDDRDRAEAAALAVLTQAGTTPRAAYTEFQHQWEALDDYDAMTGLAAVWIEAEKAADGALTEGWARPGGASCGIYC